MSITGDETSAARMYLFALAVCLLTSLSPVVVTYLFFQHRAQAVILIRELQDCIRAGGSETGCRESAQAPYWRAFVRTSPPQQIVAISSRSAEAPAQANMGKRCSRVPDHQAWPEPNSRNLSQRTRQATDRGSCHASSCPSFLSRLPRLSEPSLPHPTLLPLGLGLLACMGTAAVFGPVERMAIADEP